MKYVRGDNGDDDANVYNTTFGGNVKRTRSEDDDETDRIAQIDEFRVYASNGANA